MVNLNFPSSTSRPNLLQLQTTTPQKMGCVRVCIQSLDSFAPIAFVCALFMLWCSTFESLGACHSIVLFSPSLIYMLGYLEIRESVSPLPAFVIMCCRYLCLCSYTYLTWDLVGCNDSLSELLVPLCLNFAFWFGLLTALNLWLIRAIKKE